MTSKPTAFAMFALVLAGGAMFAESVLAAPPAPVISNPVLIYINRGFGIEVANVDGTAKTELIPQASLVRPSWGPGARIVYESPICTLWIADVVQDAGKPKAVNKTALSMPLEIISACAAEFSPVGNRLVFAEGHVEPLEISSIWTMEATDGAIPEPIYDAPEGSVVTWASYSPEGDKIAFIENGGNGQDIIKVMDSDGTDLEMLLERPGFLRSLEWSPAGGKLAYSHSTSAGEAIYTLNYPLSPPNEIPFRVTSGNGPTWSPDGSKIFFTTTTGISSIPATGGKITSIVKGGARPKYRTDP